MSAKSEVTNSGQDDATSVTVSGIFYDKNHKVLDTDYAYTKPDTIGPGQKAPFELSMFSSDAKKVKSIGVNVQSDEYSMISSKPLKPTNKE